jgi:ComF family protein
MLKELYKSLKHLIYPHYCLHCKSVFLDKDQLLCSTCTHELPLTKFEIIKDNTIEKLFWGRIKIEHAFAYGYFTKGGIFQYLIHELKYKGNIDAGILLGRLIGKCIKKSSYYKHIDILVPLPLHPLKLAKRGFNQAEIIAVGIAEETGLPIIKNIALRGKNTSTQTAKSRIERFENMRNVFYIKNIVAFENKHVLLIDDIITTGATLEACAATILEAENVKVYIAAAAYGAG